MARIQGALIVIDVQNDFCPGGSLPVPAGDDVIPVINRLMDRFNRVIATRDWHPRGHGSFASSHPGKKPFEAGILGPIEQILWPDHCVAGTPGADFHRDLCTDRFSMILHKGMNPSIDSYSAFRENDHKTNTGLEGYLRNLGIDAVYLCGLATDYCVFFSAMDAVEMGFKVCVIIDGCAGIDVPPGTVSDRINTMRSAGVSILEQGDLIHG